MMSLVSMDEMLRRDSTMNDHKFPLTPLWLQSYLVHKQFKVRELIIALSF